MSNVAEADIPFVITLIPAGFHFGSFHPRTHIAPRDSKGTVPSPSPNFTPFLTWIVIKVSLSGAKEGSHPLTSGIEPWTVISVSIQCRLADGISNGVRHVINEPFVFWISSSGVHCGGRDERQREKPTEAPLASLPGHLNPQSEPRRAQTLLAYTNSFAVFECRKSVHVGKAGTTIAYLGWLAVPIHTMYTQ